MSEAKLYAENDISGPRGKEKENEGNPTTLQKKRSQASGMLESIRQDILISKKEKVMKLDFKKTHWVFWEPKEPTGFLGFQENWENGVRLELQKKPTGFFGFLLEKPTGFWVFKKSGKMGPGMDYRRNPLGFKGGIGGINIILYYIILILMLLILKRTQEGSLEKFEKMKY